MQLSEKIAEVLRVKTSSVLLELRAIYLRDGANPLKHWTQIEDRLRTASRTSANAEEWTSAMKRGLQISSTSKSLARSMIELRDEIKAAGIPASSWLDLVEREIGYIMALTRLEAEDRKEQRNAQKEDK